MTIYLASHFVFLRYFTLCFCGKATSAGGRDRDFGASDDLKREGGSCR